jgi:hypothetical protein
MRSCTASLTALRYRSLTALQYRSHGVQVPHAFQQATEHGPRVGFGEAPPRVDHFQQLATCV